MVAEVHKFFKMPYQGRGFAPENPTAMGSSQPEVERFIDRAVVECRLEPISDEAHAAHVEGLLIRRIGRIMADWYDLAFEHGAPTLNVATCCELARIVRAVERAFEKERQS
jgi:hypothetical protein